MWARDVIAPGARLLYGRKANPKLRGARLVILQRQGRHRWTPFGGSATERGPVATPAPARGNLWHIPNLQFLQFLHLRATEVLSYPALGVLTENGIQEMLEEDGFTMR